MRALSLPGCACRGAFQFAVLERLSAAGERFDLVGAASSGCLSGALWVSGLAREGPTLFRTFKGVRVISRQHLRRERSPFGMSAILRRALEAHVPEKRLREAETELLVSTTRARAFFGGRPSTVVHSLRERRDAHDVIAASCYIPLVYARPTYLDGELHLDGGASDNTLIGELVRRGANDVTVITPHARGAVAQTLFSREAPPAPMPGVRLRLIYPERRLSQRRFDFEPTALEEALSMAHVVEIVEGRPAAKTH